MQLIDGIPVWGKEVDPGALSQIKTCQKTAEHVALMADHHKGYSVPIGGVVAYLDAISPSGVGYDIGCGNKAVLTDADANEVRANIRCPAEGNGSTTAWDGGIRQPLRGSYREHTPKGTFWRSRFSILYRPAEWQHWVEIRKPVYTIVIRLRRRRQWGFITSKGWVDHMTYGREWYD